MTRRLSPYPGVADLLFPGVSAANAHRPARRMQDIPEPEQKRRRGWVPLRRGLEPSGEPFSSPRRGS
ncbi:hypothetical protein [Tropicimonas isoalkanivorans]|uniref:Uncharacterized protein n=1 Tax=Tropicimonas isoalkanivorans TaxID=441112 RepID=A0A1I1FUR2_9RHOB|nr:hypothetical protein [Tropicimonas isoalkanivorans]SFC03045.1 hypothetical protein SAMN04488094_102294 [Tropicimonas isoalkanivorans]